MAANTCEDDVPPEFWRGFYNISGGETMRVVNHEFASALSRAVGQSDWRVSYQPNWFATRNFHGQWYTDADRLQALVPFRQETMQDFVGEVSRTVPLYIKLGAKFAAGLGRKRIQKLAESEGGPLNWVATGNASRLKAFFGSLQEWERLPTRWDKVQFEQPSRVPSYLDHGYDESKPLEQLTGDDLHHAAAFRGGTFEQQEAGDPHDAARWTCAMGHSFSLSTNLMLKGGHWCPTCMTDPSKYDDVARRSPYFEQVWRDGY